MKGVIGRISKYGFQIEGDKTVGDDGKQKWYNLSKYEKGLTLEGLSKGDTVDYEVNAKGFATKLAKDGSVPNGTATTSPASQASGANTGSGGSSYSADKDLRITRLSALSTAAAVLPLLKAEGDSLDDLMGKFETTAVRLTRYAMTGDFEASEDEKNV